MGLYEGIKKAQYRAENLNIELKISAQERIRTSTPRRELAPQASASASSATWATKLAILQGKLSVASIFCGGCVLFTFLSIPQEQLQAGAKSEAGLFAYLGEESGFFDVFLQVCGLGH